MTEMKMIDVKKVLAEKAPHLDMVIDLSWDDYETLCYNRAGPDYRPMLTRYEFESLKEWLASKDDWDPDYDLYAFNSFDWEWFGDFKSLDQAISEGERLVKSGEWERYKVYSRDLVAKGRQI